MFLDTSQVFCSVIKTIFQSDLGEFARPVRHYLPRYAQRDAKPMYSDRGAKAFQINVRKRPRDVDFQWAAETIPARQRPCPLGVVRDVDQHRCSDKPFTE